MSTIKPSKAQERVYDDLRQLGYEYSSTDEAGNIGVAFYEHGMEYTRKIYGATILRDGKVSWDTTPAS